MTYRKRRHNRHKTRNVVIGLVAVAAFITIAFVVSQSNGSGINSNASPQNGLKISSSNPVLGSPSAPVTIFEFGDFQCPSCHQWFINTEPQIVKNLINTDQAKLVWKDFIIYGPDSNKAAEAAYSAGEQGKFWQFYDLLYSRQGQADSGWASAANLQKFAQSLGLNMTQFNQSFNSDKHAQLIHNNISDGQNLGAGGTPSFFVVGPTGKTVTIAGPQPYSAFQQAVNTVLAG